MRGARGRATLPGMFDVVVCGIDGSDADAEVARQGAILAGPDGRVELHSVVFKPGEVAAAERAVRAAEAIVRDAGGRPFPDVVESTDDTAMVLATAVGADLLVVGDHHHNRADGILFGTIAATAVHRAPCPVLIARPAPDFPGPVLLADDGTDASADARRLAGAIATAHGCALETLTADGRPVKEIERAAAAARPGLLVLGSRRQRGVRALTSVSERVAPHVGCSVLVARA